LAVALTAAGTFSATLVLGRLLRVNGDLALLLGTGSAICGASAVAAMAGATKSRPDDAAYAIVAVTLAGTLGLAIMPTIGSLLGLPAHIYGLWVGGSLQEVVQAVAAGFQHGDAAGQVATIAKMERVALLAPLVMMVTAGIAMRRGAATQTGAAKGSALSGLRRLLPPWFVTAFLILAGLNSLGLIPAEMAAGTRVVAPLMMTLALAAMGARTHVATIRAQGLRPLLLCLLAALIAAVLALTFAQALAA